MEVIYSVSRSAHSGQIRRANKSLVVTLVWELDADVRKGLAYVMSESAVVLGSVSCTYKDRSPLGIAVYCACAHT